MTTALVPLNWLGTQAIREAILALFALPPNSRFERDRLTCSIIAFSHN